MIIKHFKAIVLLSLTLLLTLVTIDMVLSVSKISHASSSAAENQDLPSFTLDELKKYDGTDPQLPIYLAYEGKVYDLSSGRSFYQSGATYHFLAGKDSTTELNFAGGGIIKSKYPVVGKLVNNSSN